MAAMMINCEAFHNKLPPFPNLQRNEEQYGKAINEEINDILKFLNFVSTLF